MATYFAGRNKLLNYSLNHDKDTHEEIMEIRMNKEHGNKTVDQLMHESNLSGDGSILRDLGVQLIIGIYCTRGFNFDPTKVEEKFNKLGLCTMTCIKLMHLLTRWRKGIPATNPVIHDILSDSQSSC
jgi:hypothetical protein